MPLPKKKRPNSHLSMREQRELDQQREQNRQYEPVALAARQRAEQLYADGKFLCSEAVFAVVNDHLGQPANPLMVKMASGFPVGVGMSGCICGALAGGVMALGLKYGREQEGEALSDDIFPLSAELHDRFEHRNGSVCCKKLLQKVEFGSPEHIKQCIRFTGDIAADVVDLIENGVQGADPRLKAANSAAEGAGAADQDCGGCDNARL
ncbi:hypothetical protein NFHSH190041_34320 [Shewanella sp. NFH-SH190041]|uniref:C-GCAxxG-C-C family protein n=1 Tax=Shewanella sp. NFH-SH190041 TaxID=2950245 RepID=UPI0021C44630|nr:C-GCAxxG-C-C family protein [Shewanella sp. NFH-SH190041]BDM65980.1 hypothetical protein NFHSH190041_34320 [Shewanella sp. NFH-SH190041]